METIGFNMFICLIIYIDYKMYIRGNSCFLFKDKTELEKDLRKLQELETKLKIKQLEDKIK